MHYHWEELLSEEYHDRERKLSRIEVPGGWIYKYATLYCTGEELKCELVFVPKPPDAPVPAYYESLVRPGGC